MSDRCEIPAGNRPERPRPTGLRVCPRPRERSCEAMRLSSPRRHLGLLLALPLVSACGGGGGGGSSVDPNAPILSNLRLTTGGSCTISGVNLPGTVEVFTFDYADADGNLRGGT